jgi:prepilin-type N-terminal cleavage/methylation domain-containing protein
MTLKEKYSKQYGFTLIEVLVSIVILSIVLTSFFAFFSQSMVFSGKNEEDLVAFNLANKTLKTVESKYKVETLSQNLTFNSCSNYPQNIKDILNLSSTCSYNVNKKRYYPEITLTKQAYVNNSGENLPTLYIINVKIFGSPSQPKKLLSETYGYVRGQ